MVALDIKVNASESWDRWQWWRLPPSRVHPYDIVDLGADVTYSNTGLVKQDRSNYGHNPSSQWYITHVTLEGHGQYRIGFLPLGGHGGQIDLAFDHNYRLLVKR